MSWNYRVIKYEDGSHQIHEVYYDDYGTPDGCTVSCASPYGETYEEFSKDLANYTKAIEKPVIDMKIFDDMEAAAEEKETDG